ncbi:MAG: hypothetical protein MUE50_26880 [Pirellulaceae bacterium]|nr:hypothetical protein [Pirellulaceae bacterium]
MNRSPWLGLVALALGLATHAVADLQDSFESAQPTWRLADADCGARIAVQRRDFKTYRTGQASEYLSVVANQGTYSYLIHPIPQSRVLAEWMATLWVKADRTGLQLLARVVLPRSRDPQTGGPMTVLLRGDVYDRSGLWQQLTIREADQLLERQVRVLRLDRRYGTARPDRRQPVCVQQQRGAGPRGGRSAAAGGRHGAAGSQPR